MSACITFICNVQVQTFGWHGFQNWLYDCISEPVLLAKTNTGGMAQRWKNKAKLTHVNETHQNLIKGYQEFGGNGSEAFVLSHKLSPPWMVPSALTFVESKLQSSRHHSSQAGSTHGVRLASCPFIIPWHQKQIKGRAKGSAYFVKCIYILLKGNCLTSVWGSENTPQSFIGMRSARLWLQEHCEGYFL